MSHNNSTPLKRRHYVVIVIKVRRVLKIHSGMETFQMKWIFIPVEKNFDLLPKCTAEYDDI